MENCEDHVKVATRQKVREFCNQLMESFSKERPPIYLLATIVDVNKADNFDTEKTVQVINYLFSLRQPCLVASLMFRYFKFVMSILEKKIKSMVGHHNYHVISDSYHFIQGHPWQSVIM